MKKCSGCKEEKPVESFTKDIKTKSGLKAYCRECRAKEGRLARDKIKNDPLRLAKHKETNRQYRLSHKEQRSDAERQRKSRMSSEEIKNECLMATYGISLAQYKTLLDAQGGGCAICGRKTPGCGKTKYLYVDHDHATNKIRGILCFGCNWGIGFLESDKYEKAASYLLEPPAASVGLNVEIREGHVVSVAKRKAKRKGGF